MDVLSMMRRAMDNDLLCANALFAPVEGNGFILSVQASKYHCCSPRVDGLSAYLYDSFEVAIYSETEISDVIKDKFDWRFDECCNIVENVTPEELNWLYREMMI